MIPQSLLPRARGMRGSSGVSALSRQVAPAGAPDAGIGLLTRPVLQTCSRGRCRIAGSTTIQAK